VLAGGWYFATQVARVLGGAGGALTAEQGAALLAPKLAGDDSPRGLASLGAIARADRESLGALEGPEPGAILPGEVTR
jgi:hypothetical protein